MISKDLQEGGAELEALSATLGSVLPAPLAGKDVVTRSVLIGRSAMLALRMLCELEDSLGVQGLNTDWGCTCPRVSETRRNRGWPAK